MRQVDVDLGAESYRILIDDSSLSDVGRLCETELGGDRGVVITDGTVDRIYGKDLERSLTAQGIDYEKIVVRPGEGSKSLETANRLYDDLAEMNLHRDSIVLAFGGGVVGDLAGFVGSTFLRGLPVLQIPTTLLAQVDSSVGGKTAVNLSRGKNLVGTFHQPSLVVIDPLVLETLSPEDLRSGLGEVLKYGVIWDRHLFSRVAGEGISFDDVNFLEEIISRCCEIKAEIVGRDERDRGVRRILNFGHTLGHGIEAGSGYGGMKHGEAVVWGMIGEAWISRERGYLPEEEFSEIVSSLVELELPTLPENLTTGELLKYVRRDKKVRGGAIQSVLVKRLGEEVVVEEISESEVKTGWEYLNDLEADRFDTGS